MKTGKKTKCRRHKKHEVEEKRKINAFLKTQKPQRNIRNIKASQNPRQSGFFVIPCWTWLMSSILVKCKEYFSCAFPSLFVTNKSERKTN